MKSLLMLCALLGLTASSYYPGLYAGAGHWGYGAAHIVIGPHGVPIDTPEVASLKAAHAAWHVDSATRAAHSPEYPVGLPYSHGYAVPYALGYASPYVHGHLPQPVHDTPEVAAAKVAHFAAHAAAAHHGRKKRSYGAYGVGYPLAYGHGAYGHGAYGYSHLPQPVHDTPEVAAAKVAHAHAYSEAASRAAASPDYSSGHYSGAYQGGAYDDGQYRGEGAVGHYAPAAYHGGAYDDGQYRVAAHEDGSYHGEGAYHGGAYDDGQYRGEGAYHGAYHGGYHGPAAHIVIGPGGVPLDTPEVAHARAAHLAEKAKVSGHYGHHY